MTCLTHIPCKHDTAFEGQANLRAAGELYIFVIQLTPQSPPDFVEEHGRQAFRLPAERKHPSMTIGVRAVRTFLKCPFEDQGSGSRVADGTCPSNYTLRFKLMDSLRRPSLEDHFMKK